jgi:protein translocase SecG subunit
MMLTVLLFSWYGLTWSILSLVVFVVSVLMVGFILIQDSKDTGLTNAFGGGGTSNALLGARMQKDLAKLTAILAIILALCLTILGFLDANAGKRTLGAMNTSPGTVNSGTVNPGTVNPGTVNPGTGDSGTGTSGTASPETTFPSGGLGAGGLGSAAPGAGTAAPGSGPLPMAELPPPAGSSGGSSTPSPAPGGTPTPAAGGTGNAGAAPPVNPSKPDPAPGSQPSQQPAPQQPVPQQK